MKLVFMEGVGAYLEPQISTLRFSS